MEPWQRVWIDAQTYSTDLHSLINCTTCHKGTASTDMNTAHTGMVKAPSQDPETCGTCHTDITPASLNSLHSTLAGYDTVLYERSVPENHATLEQAEANHCNSCHTTCGDCHVSQPKSVGSGLLKGHDFVKTPPMSQTCTGCHGSRVKNEYYGLNEELPSDVHFRARMSCESCHTANEIHGVGMTNVDHRYDGQQGPTCESCHQDKVGIGSGIEQHEIHGTEILSCQSCHSVAYTNCVNCHVEQNTDKVSFYKIEKSFLGFYLGKNPLQNAERPYRYVPVRHVPVDKDSFSFYGQNLLQNFDVRPTWAYSTPHNIQRITPQTEDCTNCHGNDAVFLTADKVAPAELKANEKVIVQKAPMLSENYIRKGVPTIAPTKGGDDFWGGGGTSPTATPSGGGDFWGGGESSPAATPTTSGSDFWGGGSASPTATPTSANFWGQ